MTVVVTHTTPADSTFSSTGAAAWNADHALSGVGTMAEQNANNVAITGGTINNTTIGATTPSTGVFTTLTAQTEVLKGTGQNLLLQSQTFTNAYWGKVESTVTGNSTTAPDSTSTASTLFETTANSRHVIFGSQVVTSTIYTFSIYLKAQNTTFAQVQLAQTGLYFATLVNLSTGAIVTNTSSGSPTNTNSIITSVGNGWYRVAITLTLSASAGNVFYVVSTSNSATPTYEGAGNPTYVGNASNGIFIWGAQFELGSTANTYIPTTTTAVYGTPTLSFSGVASIGLQSDGSLYHQPAGTGAVQAQATTSSATGGNARGANAVDWQTLRDFAVKVASGVSSFLGGGQYNQASGGQSVTVGGNNVVTSGSKAVSVGGDTNTNAAQLAFLGGGYTQTLSSNGQFGFLGGGYANTLAGFYNVIGGGYTNSGTSGSAVTTQSSTMNGTTAVTLGASNASIKVGQLITGTFINSFPATYVAAISGTSLTLSQVASGSGTSTLSFFTPHGVVVGGGNNQATGSYSFIGGGGDAGTAANRNVASGDWSAVVGGRNNTASGSGSFVGGGGVFPTINNLYPNTASGIASAVVGGLTNTATNEGAFIGGGSGNTANGRYSFVVWWIWTGTTRGVIGYHGFPCNSNASSIDNSRSHNKPHCLLLGNETLQMQLPQ
jgi:hypothetical protein